MSNYPETGKQRKTFRQFTPDGQGGWKPGLSGLQPPLYRLPELRAAPAGSVVYLTEGEKHSDALAACERPRHDRGGPGRV